MFVAQGHTAISRPVPVQEQLHRYPVFRVSASALAIDADLIDWVSGLSSRGVVSDLLHHRHGMTERTQIREAASEIQTYVRQGLRFLDQARSGPSGVAFIA